MNWFFAMVLLGISSARAGGLDLMAKFKDAPDMDSQIEQMKKEYPHEDEWMIVFKVYGDRVKELDRMHEVQERKISENRLNYLQNDMKYRQEDIDIVDESVRELREGRFRIKVLQDLKRREANGGKRG